MPPVPTKLHLRVEKFHRDAKYKSKRQARSKGVPPRAHSQQHGGKLSSQLKQVKDDYSSMAAAWQGNEDITELGLTIEIESAPDVLVDCQRLEDGGWHLLTEQTSAAAAGEVTFQRWFVPDGKLDVLEKIIQAYLTETQKVKGVPLPKYRPLIDAIERVGRAAANQLWTEEHEPFPEDQTLWFEVWLRAGTTKDEREAILEQFRKRAGTAGLVVGTALITFPEHTILSVWGQGASFSQDLALLNCIAEIRRARDYADRYDNMPASAQMEQVHALLARVSPASEGACYIVVMDTGINRGHPLLSEPLTEEDNLTIKAEWTAADDDSHGTMMAGLCLLGDFTPLLGKTEPIRLISRLEGVKIVPPVAIQNADEKLAGAYTAQGIALAEGKNPSRRRVWCIATSMKESNDPAPTSWSSQLDALASGVDNDGQVQRLLCLSAGNVPQKYWAAYPRSNHGYSAENPSQSWNAICVGACTDLKLITSATGYEPRAPRGALSPSSST